MTTNPTTPKETFLSDYKQPNYWVDKVNLHFDLAPDTTKVISRLSMRRNKTATSSECVLDGEQLELVSVKLDGRLLEGNEYQRTDKYLLISSVPDKFDLEIVTLIHPAENTALEGLYHSGNLLCTQCEAEGFRRITYYPDRPDVMAVFTVSLAADKDSWPILLANGNLEEQGVFEDGRHWVRWHDPHPKPSYLFALVAGDLYVQRDKFITLSGREVKLEIFVDHENSHKCEHALMSLKQAMKWDEDTYGREYDLDVFMIVAVNDFNMGAMENKGLNIFNAACVLASPDTATDQDYYTIQSIVGHEYFHNWSGNRVTCRDWFQLSLKEGFTVLRDQQFSADLNSAVVQRIADVNQLRSMQFAEDAGPMAHPVRPASFIEISNFYTVTIYEKGAEVVGMIKTLVGDAGFRKGTDLYFERHDGQAVTTDDFVKAIEDANQVDLTQFKRWYSQAGTPVVSVKTYYDSSKRQYSLTLSQQCPATPDQTDKQPFHIPIAIGLIDKHGKAVPLQLINEKPISTQTVVLSLVNTEQTFTFVNIDSEPVPSILRGFSAPVKLEHTRTSSELAFLMSKDSDSFNRWDAGQQLFINVLIDLINNVEQDKELSLPTVLIDQLNTVLSESEKDPALVAKMLSIPSENYLAAQTKPANVDAIHAARQFLKKQIATQFKSTFQAIYQRLNQQKKPYSFNAHDMAQRSLKNTSLGFLMATGDPMETQRCLKQMKEADNMTDLLAGLSLMADQKGPEAEHAIRAFYEQWKHDRQVVDKWLTVQALSNQPDTLLRVKGLLKHPAFSMKNPNNVRAVIGQFCRNNPINFHAKDGSGYRFLAEQIIELNKLNPQVAARQLGAFNSWQQYDTERQSMIKKALQSIAEQDGLSPDVYEVVTKYLAAGKA